LDVGPLLAGLPISFQPLAELLTRLDLLSRQRGLFGVQVPGLCLACFGTREAVVRAMSRLDVVLAAAILVTALHPALGHRAAAHRFRLCQCCCELTDGSWYGFDRHGHLLRLL
jgi:hypothetical protein